MSAREQIVLEVGSDHAGVQLRDELVAWLRAGDYEVADVLGPASSEERVDYPDIASEIARRVAQADSSHPKRLGLLVCGTGQGVAMAANRVRGVRAAVCSDVFSAKMARAHNDANILCLGARVIGSGLAVEVLRAYLESSFEGGRHAARVAKIG